MQPYTAKDFSQLLGLPGMSDALLNNHFTLYQGYVTNTNKLVELMKDKEPGTPEFAELHRRFGWEWNGVRNHELFFDSLSIKKDTDVSEKILKIIFFF
jgi:Fe-Mn family superoxide dismutase